MQSGGTVFTSDDSEGGLGGGGGTVPDPVFTIVINPSHLPGIMGVFFGGKSLGVGVEISVGGLIIMIIIRFIHI